MKKIIIIIMIMTCNAYGFTSSLDNPHWIRVSTCGEKELINKNVEIYFNHYSTGELCGKVLDYSLYDLKLKSGESIYIIPSGSIKFIRVVNK